MKFSLYEQTSLFLLKLNLYLSIQQSVKIIWNQAEIIKYAINIFSIMVSVK